MKKLVVFDMDGVLVDSEDGMAKMTVKALEEWGIHPNEDEFRPYRGRGDRIYVGSIAEKYGLKYEDRMKDEAYRLFCENAKEIVNVLPWSIRLLNTLDSLGYKKCIASSADRIKVKANLSCLGRTDDDFDAVVDGSEVKNLKPDPEIFLLAAEKCGYKPSDCVVCEDALSGVKAAKSAGMYAVAVPTSYSREALYEAGADIVVDDLFDLVSVLEKM